MFRIPIHKAARLIAAVCVLSALCLAFFASCTDRPADNAGTLTISVSDATPKMLMYTPSDGGPSAMSHYGVILKNAEGETLKSTENPMPLYESSGSFTITGLVSGTYTVDATGYIKTGDTYTAIATGTTGSFQLNPSSATTKTIAIDTWTAGNASSVTVDIVMPTDVITGSTATGTLTYALNKVEDNSSVIAEKSIQLSSQALTNGKYTLTIPETIAPGRYVLIAGFTASGDDYKYMGAQAMLVYPNLPVTGTLSLDSNLAFESGFTVEDGIGGVIEVSGDGTYASDTDIVSIVLSNALDTGCSIVWYVDGVELAVDDYSVSGTAYTFTGLATGKRNIVGIVWDSGKKASIGALCINVDVRKKPVIEEILPPTVVGAAWDYGDSDSQLYRLYTSEITKTEATSAGMKAMDDPYNLVTMDIMAEPVASSEGNPGSSPFDELNPWKEMKLYALNDGGSVKDVIEEDETIRQFVNEHNDGTVDFMVYLPEAYLRVIDDSVNSIRYYYVSDSEFEGSSLHPASGHYIGRYNGYIQEHTDGTINDLLWSQPSGTSTATQFAQELWHAEAYDVAHNRVSTVSGKIYGGLLWEEVSYVQLMYLVEYANLNSQATIGYGDSDYESGNSDDMPYHTGVLGSKTTYDSDVQYRYIEGLFGADRGGDIVENLLADNRMMYIAPDEESLAAASESGVFSDFNGMYEVPTDWINIGTLPNSGWITEMNYNPAYPWSIGIPSKTGGNDTTYTCDEVSTSSALCSVVLSYYESPVCGVWKMRADTAPASVNGIATARLSFR